ncbi:heme-binding protein 2-like isoform X1 [Branchiostoma floridae]|uniref:Heme-binding protein 2-like isoform X1 n=1 Tax=Branchiostoma floridae TaxID=7739 RepID=A0A9J7M377_BRAFL|nr:heme-binding protein 2-like isoform X1 [Branchiostoma floridae]
MAVVKEIFKTMFGTLDSPNHSVVSSSAVRKLFTRMDYEERKYEGARWTSTTIPDIEHRTAVSTGFRRLFKYISGHNEKQVRIPMTVPVLTKVEPGDGQTDFMVSFFAPHADQAEGTAQPSDPEVFNNSLPEMTAYVKTFSGYAKDEDWTKQAELLAKSLDNDGKKYHKDFYYTAGYNSPFKPINRHNEVWYIKAE